MDDLFDGGKTPGQSAEPFGDGAMLLRGMASSAGEDLPQALDRVSAISPFRQMVTPGGFTMSVEMTNCGAAGWVTDRSGYRYAREDPLTGRPWPEMPPALRSLAVSAAARAGYADFQPDACLINIYRPGARLSLHQDKNERDFAQPIVSLSFGLPAIFQFGGLRRDAKVGKYELRHGDVAVWGGPTRLCFHGVPALKDGHHPLIGRRRISLTFRKAL